MNKMAKNNKMPAIRFSGYTDTWEQRKLGEFVKIVSGDAPSTFISGNCVYVKVDDLNYSDRIQLSSSNLVNANPKAHLVNQGATIFPKRGAAIMTNKVRIMGKDGYLDTNMMALIPEEIDKDFLFTFIQKTGLYKIADTSTIPQINNKHIEPYMIQVPSEKEQAYIGVVFKKIDKIITLHQRKLEKLKLTKKALLQKLFPQNGSKFPELRFKGFTAAWEQCKLSDITEIVMGQSPSSKNYTDNPNDNILVQGNADLKDGKVVPRLWTKEITKTIDKDGIVLTVRAPVGDVAKTDYKVVLGRGVAGIKGNDYIYQFLQKLQNNRYWVSLSSGSTFESINSNDIKDLIIDIPSIEEQTKISMLLNNVNSIITLHQRKLEMLKNVKKGLLQKMFV